MTQKKQKLGTHKRIFKVALVNGGTKNMAFYELKN